MGRARGLPGIVAALILLAIALGAATARPAAPTLGLISHYELCERDTWLSLDDIAVKTSSGDIWVEGGIFPARLIHATTAGDVIGSHDGKGIPNGFTDSFGVSFFVAHSPTGVYVADANERYVNARGRLLKFSAEQQPRFVQHFKRPPGSIPSDATGLSTPHDVMSFTHGGVDYVAALDYGSIIIYDDTGKYVDTVTPIANPDAPKSPTITWGGVPGGMAVASGTIVVSDPARKKVMAYALQRTDTPSGPDFKLVFGLEYDIHVGRIASAPDGTFWGLTPTGLGHYAGIPAQLVEHVEIEGANSLTVGGDGHVYVTRRDGVLRIGSGGGPIPEPQNAYPNRCGAPRITRLVPSSQDIAGTKQLAMFATCDEPCRMQISGTLSVPRSGTFKLRPSSRSLSRGVRARMTLGFTNAALRALAAAKRRDVRSTARIQMIATDTGGTIRRQPVLLHLT